ncbi:MAG: hypothetical protein ABWY12_04275 [Burkholderiales bacterium]
MGGLALTSERACARGQALASSADTRFQNEELGIERCHWRPKLLDLGSGGVNFQPDDLGDLQGITKQFANALQVIEERGTVSVALTAVSNGCR